MKSIFLALFLSTNALAATETFVQTVGGVSYLMSSMDTSEHNHALFETGPMSCPSLTVEVACGPSFVYGPNNDNIQGSQKREEDGGFTCGLFSNPKQKISGKCSSITMSLGNAVDNCVPVLAGAEQRKDAVEPYELAKQLPGTITTDGVNPEFICPIDGQCGSVNGIEYEKSADGSSCDVKPTASPTRAPTFLAVDGNWGYAMGADDNGYTAVGAGDGGCSKKCDDGNGAGTQTQVCLDQAGIGKNCTDTTNPNTTGNAAAQRDCNTHACNSGVWTATGRCDKEGSKGEEIICGAGKQYYDCVKNTEFQDSCAGDQPVDACGHDTSNVMGKPVCSACNYKDNCVRQQDGSLKNAADDDLQTANGEKLDTAQIQTWKTQCDCSKPAALDGTADSYSYLTCNVAAAT